MPVGFTLLWHPVWVQDFQAIGSPFWFMRGRKEGSPLLPQKRADGRGEGGVVENSMKSDINYSSGRLEHIARGLGLGL